MGSLRYVLFGRHGRALSSAAPRSLLSGALSGPGDMNIQDAMWMHRAAFAYDGVCVGY